MAGSARRRYVGVSVSMSAHRLPAEYQGRIAVAKAF